METHKFPEVVKVQRFCLTLTVEARLWYEPLRPIVVSWQGHKINLGNSILRLVTCETNYFMCGDLFIKMKILRQWACM